MPVYKGNNPMDKQIFDMFNAIQNKLDKLPCMNHVERIRGVENGINAHSEMHETLDKKRIALVGVWRMVFLAVGLGILVLEVMKVIPK